MTNHRIIVSETGEKFELLCGGSQQRRMVKLIEGKKIFSKAKTRSAKYQIPAEAYNIIKEHPQCYLHRDGLTNVVWISDKEPVYVDGEVVFRSEDLSHLYLEIVTFDLFIPANTIVSCSDVLKYGSVINE